MAMLQIPSESVILRDTLRTRALRLAQQQQEQEQGGGKPLGSISVNLVEFDDVGYRLTANAAEPAKLLVSLALPPQPNKQVAAHPDAAAAVNEAFGSCAQVVSSEQGFHLTLEVFLDRLPVQDEAQLDQYNPLTRAEFDKLCTSNMPGEWPRKTITTDYKKYLNEIRPSNFIEMVNKLSALRALVMGTPLRNQLALLAAGTCVEAPLIAIPHRTGEEFFVKPQEDSVTVIFPMRFKDPSDATMACTFLAEFVEARRQASLTTAPSCSYSKPPPLELRGGPPTALGANGGYVSFVLFKRHVSDKGKLEQSTWRLSTFYGFINYHIKCSKAYMHSRMRKRTQGLLQVLNRAKPDVVKEKKKADGRTFVRS